MTEVELQIQVADYLRLQYPDVLFKPDFGSGVRLTPQQAARQKRQSGGLRGWPDLFIAESAYVRAPLFRDKPDLVNCRKLHHGLFIELKKEGTRLTKLNGEWATPHIAEQAEMLEKLISKGYYADFACGFDEAKAVLDRYLQGRSR